MSQAAGSEGAPTARQPIALPVLIALLVGASVGLGLFTFGHARGASYFVDDPNACANCHAMRGHLDAWVKSAHSKRATCNDCHAPRALLPRYYSKARNGFLHSLAFTTGGYETNFRIDDFNREITESACRSCHARIVHAIDRRVPTAGDSARLDCIRCHSAAGHDR